MLFRELGLRSEIIESLDTMGYQEPTEVQSLVIPQAVAGKNIIAQSQTGSGKTAAFVIPILNAIDTGLRKPQALILEPTRELAMQSKEEVWNLSKWMRMRSAVVFGGSYIRKQRDELESGPQVVIATPWRLLDLIDRGWIDLSAVKSLVIDEVDLMMDMGFIEAVDAIWQKLPSLKQVMTFSATYSAEILRLIGSHIGNSYEMIQVSKTLTVETIDHAFIRVSQIDKYPMLKKIITENVGKRVIIFTKMKSETEEIFRYLERDGIESAYLHGDLYQRDRIRTLRDYKEGRIHIFIATDIAARGLNMNNIDIVINYHVPHDPESYIHRIGRTGRAGASGRAVMFVASDEIRQVQRIERVNRIEIAEIDGNSNPLPRTIGQNQRSEWGGGARRRPFNRRGGGGGYSGYRKPYSQGEHRREWSTPHTPRPIRPYREQTGGFFERENGKFFPVSWERKHDDRPTRPTHRYEERRNNHPREPRTRDE